MRDESTQTGRCDVCGHYATLAALNKLFPRYQTPEVADVCNECHDAIHRAWDRGRKVTDGLLADLTRRAIRSRKVRCSVRAWTGWRRVLGLGGDDA